MKPPSARLVPDHIATIVGDPARAVVTRDMIAQLAHAIDGAQPPDWLCEGVAADVAFAAAGPAALAEIESSLAAAARALGAPVDVFVQPRAHRRKRLLIADMDSTMIGQECIDELADFVGLKAEVSAITERAMRGEISFEPALRERVLLLRGLPLSTIDAIIAERITLTPGGRALVATMRANGAMCCLASGGFTLFTAHVAGVLGFDEHRANVLDIEGSHLAGTVREPILGRAAKRAALVEISSRLGLAHEDTLAVGDGANDLDMLQAAGMGVAFRAKPAVAAAAHARIDHSDLSALLYLQGYRAADIRL